MSAVRRPALETHSTCGEKVALCLAQSCPSGLKESGSNSELAFHRQPFGGHLHLDLWPQSHFQVFQATKERRF